MALLSREPSQRATGALLPDRPLQSDLPYEILLADVCLLE